MTEDKQTMKLIVITLDDTERLFLRDILPQVKEGIVEDNPKVRESVNELIDRLLKKIGDD